MSAFTESKTYRQCQALFDRWYPDFKNAGLRYQMLVDGALDADKAVLELGCGAMSLAEDSLRRAKMSAGVDLVLSALQANTVVDYPILANSDHLPFASETFDVVISQWVIEHLPNPGQTFTEIARVLRPGGEIILFTTNANNYIPLLSRLTPDRLQDDILEKVLHRPGHESFPTHYKANSRKALQHLAGQAGLHLEEVIFVGNPFYLAFSRPLFYLALLFEKLTDHARLQGLKLYLLAKLSKPAE